MAKIFQVRLEQTWLAQQCYNITYWLLPDEGAATLQEHCDALAGLFDEFKSSFASAWQFTGCSYRLFDGQPPYTSLVTPTGGAITGTGTGGSMPTQVAPVLTLTYIGTPPNRGRMYLAGSPVSNHETNGQLKTGAQGNFLALGEALTDGFELSQGDATLIIARPNFASNQVSLWQPVTGVSMSTVYGTQRRRRIGAGS